MNREDLTGQKIDKLYIESIVDTRRGENIYNIVCDCGNKIQRSTSKIKRLKYKSCGCYTDHRKGINRLEGSSAAINKLYRSYKDSAKDRDLSFELTKDQFSLLTSLDCVYCGAKPNQIIGKQYVQVYVYNGIDRSYNEIGYTWDNSVPCCWTCNRMKGTMSGADFVNHCTLVSDTMLAARDRYKEK